MTPGTVVLAEGELERRVAAFEAAWTTGGSADLRAFLPPRDSPAFAAVLSELIRIDLEFRGGRGESPRFAAYRPEAPDLFADPAWLAEIAFEEYRQRLALGESPWPGEYAAAYGVDVTGWPAPQDHTPKPPAFPRDGETVGPFRILRELGRGSFGRVYLAAQTDLADRPVAVKVSTRFGRTEPETLAKLQHTHIVPIYSAQQVGRVQAIVMPYLGATTLADVLASLRARGVWPASGKALADTVANRASRTKLAEDATPAEGTDRTPLHLPLEELRKLTFPDAVLWIGCKLAEALAHAHDRGILHRDIKPANVLVTDDGQPMLLDFNLAADAARAEEGIGGTPAYMAPEQVAAMKGGPRRVDHRADVYSLGLVLAELLIGRSPFSAGDPRPQLSRWNATVSPSTEAILRKCLAVDPAGRYSSAGQLAEEFRRQLAHQPLLATREPSPRERFRKWRRRHPLLASTGSLAAVAGVLILGLSAVVVAGQRHRVAAQKYRDFQQAAPAVIDRVTLGGRDSASRRSAREQLDGLLATYAEAADVRRLPEADQADLHEQLGELLVLKSRLEPDPHVALEINKQAADAFRRRGAIPRTVWDDRRAFAKKLLRGDDAAEAEAQALETEGQSRDWYFSGLTAHDAGDYVTAARLFTDAVAHNPKHYWSWAMLGDSLALIGHDAQAEGCFNAAIALKPDLYAAYFNRGMCRFRQKNYPAAVTDFSKALSLQPGHEKALIARGRAYQESERWAEAEADFTAALDGGTTETRPYLLRAEVRERRGNGGGAAKDRAEGMKRDPTDELSWITRGLAKAAANDFAGALADYDGALAINPQSYVALMNKANVLDEKLHRDADAIRVLDTIVGLQPSRLLALSGRAVLLARQGNRKAALDDAETCRKASRDRELTYQLAGVYALTSKVQAEDAKVAYQLLREALHAGYGFDLLGIDPDLEPIRGGKEFQQMVEAGRVLAPSR